MKKIFFILTIFLLSLSAAKAQSITFSNFEKVRAIPGAYISFSIDNLENIYLLSATNQLKKLNSKGDSIAVFNDIKKFGEATLVDVSNPLKILLYYKNFATIAVLDGMLNLKTTIDLRKQNMFRVNAIGLSYDGKIWLYDELDNTLKKIDDQGKVIQKTTDLRQVFSKAIEPKKIYDQNQYVYLYDPQQGIFVFDYYGTFKNRIDITGWNNLRVTDKFVLGTDSSFIRRYEIPTFRYEQWPIPAPLTEYKQIVYAVNFLYALNENGLDIIRIPQ